MGRKKKRKLKKKALIMIFGIFLLIGSIITVIGIHYINVNNHFHKYVMSNKTTYLYNKNRKVVGTLFKNYSLELTNSNKITGYFKIKDTNYYVYYQNLKKGQKKDSISISENQVPLDKKITITKKATLYKEKEKVITLKEKTTFDVAYENNENYYVYFQNDLLRIPKEKSIKEETNESKEEIANHVSVLFYETIADNCKDSNCITITNFKSQMTELLNQNYYMLTREEFKDYINGYIHLKPKAIFITTSNDSLDFIEEEYKALIQNINNEKELKYFSTNQTNTSENTKDSINRYQIKNSTATEDIIKMAEGEQMEIVQDKQGIAVINYHFFYTEGESCNETICLETSKFREQLDYLKENHYKTLTMSEFKRWMYGEIELPTRSVLLTVDDGAMGTGTHNGNKLIPILEEYDMHATLFLIAGWWSIENYRSPNLDIQSHTYDMHQYGSCGRGQINCGTYEQAKEDLEKSLSIIGNDDSFCFPFYMYNDTSLKAVKDVGFKLAFIGGNRKANRQMNKYLITRYPIQNNSSLQYFISIVS